MRATTVITGKFDAKFCEPQSLQEFLDKGGESLLYACIYEHAGCQDADDLYQDHLHLEVLRKHNQDAVPEAHLPQGKG